MSKGRVKTDFTELELELGRAIKSICPDSLFIDVTFSCVEDNEDDQKELLDYINNHPTATHDEIATVSTHIYNYRHGIEKRQK